MARSDRSPRPNAQIVGHRPWWRLRPRIARSDAVVLPDQPRGHVAIESGSPLYIVIPDSRPSREIEGGRSTAGQRSSIVRTTKNYEFVSPTMRPARGNMALSRWCRTSTHQPVSSTTRAAELAVAHSRGSQLILFSDDIGSLSGSGDIGSRNRNRSGRLALNCALRTDDCSTSAW